MLDTLNLIKKIMQSNVEFITEEQRLRPTDSEVLRLWGDNSQIASLTKWQPEFTLEEGLSITCQWFQNQKNLRKYKPGIYNL